MITVYTIRKVVRCETIAKIAQRERNLWYNAKIRKEKGDMIMENSDYRPIFQRKEDHPGIVHCITNYVTVNDVANIILACGASPIMADDPEEVEEITTISTDLLLNMGTLSRRKAKAMLLAGKKANELGHPVILDPVGVGASTFRKEVVRKLLDEIHFSVIRGNLSEIKAIFYGNQEEMGVDAASSDMITKENLKEMIAMAKKAAKQMQSVIVMTGAIDLVADCHRACVVYNGSQMMTRITGSGCMLDGVIAGFVGSNKDCVWEAASLAVISMGICGEIAEETCKGTGSFRTHLMDAMSRLTMDEIERRLKIEVNI